jgi:hypothetical protein
VRFLPPNVFFSLLEEKKLYILSSKNIGSEQSKKKFSILLRKHYNTVGDMLESTVPQMIRKVGDASVVDEVRRILSLK